MQFKTRKLQLCQYTVLLFKNINASTKDKYQPSTTLCHKAAFHRAARRFPLLNVKCSLTAGLDMGDFLHARAACPRTRYPTSFK
jgi:hypothetical protein